MDFDLNLKGEEFLAVWRDDDVSKVITVSVKFVIKKTLNWSSLFCYLLLFEQHQGHNLAKGNRCWTVCSVAVSWTAVLECIEQKVLSSVLVRKFWTECIK